MTFPHLLGHGLSFLPDALSVLSHLPRYRRPSDTWSPWLAAQAGRWDSWAGLADCDLYRAVAWQDMAARISWLTRLPKENTSDDLPGGDRPAFQCPGRRGQGWGLGIQCALDSCFYHGPSTASGPDVPQSRGPLSGPRRGRVWPGGQAQGPSYGQGLWTVRFSTTFPASPACSVSAPLLLLRGPQGHRPESQPLTRFLTHSHPAFLSPFSQSAITLFWKRVCLCHGGVGP